METQTLAHMSVNGSRLCISISKFSPSFFSRSKTPHFQIRTHSKQKHTFYQSETLEIRIPSVDCRKQKQNLRRSSLFAGALVLSLFAGALGLSLFARVRLFQKWEMAETSRKMDMEELLTYGNNLIELLEEKKEVAGLKHLLGQSEALESQCVKDFNEAQRSIEDYEKKIYECKQKSVAAVSESASDAEIDSLQKELDNGQKLEWMLKEDLRVIVNEIDDLERQRVFGEEEMQTIKKIEQDELKAQMKLSMYASVTNIIPHLDDPSKISGCIVTRDKQVVKKFEFDPSEVFCFDTCNDIWKMINS